MEGRRRRRSAGGFCSSWPRSCATRADELAELETRNSGKPIVEAEFDIADVATCFEYYGGLATKIHGDVMPVPDNAMSLALREPIGVAGQIIPWNYPLLMAAWKLAPAICAGCTTVLKPAEQTPLTVLELASSFADAGLPPGVVNIVTGVGETAGAAIVEHPDVDKIAFTGSVEVGKTIMRAAADTLKKISLELGGKSPNIFFADADFEAAVDGALFGVFFNQGEVCSAGSRILVAASDLQEVRRRDGREGARHHRRSAARSRHEDGGARQPRAVRPRARVSGDRQARKRRLAVGGGRATGAALDRGYFVEPTIFYDVDNSARIAREEIFGPVACVIPFDDEDGRAANRQRHLLRPRGGRLDARHLPRDARGEEPARRHRLGEPHAADLRRSAVGRLQAERHRPRARQVGRRGIPATSSRCTSTSRNSRSAGTDRIGCNCKGGQP